MKNRLLLLSFILFISFIPFSRVVASTQPTNYNDSIANISQSINEDDIVRKVLSHLPKISGYLQTGYAWEDKNAGNSSSFMMKRSRLMIEKEMSPMFDMRMQFEIFSGSTDKNIGKKVMTIIDAFVNTHLHKSLHFRLGQYNLPLGFENYDQSPGTHETIDLSSINGRMVCRNPVSNPSHLDYGRDIGLMAYGDFFASNDKSFNYLSYNLSLTNGHIITLPDNNKSKDFIGRLVFQPIKDLRILANYNWGEYDRTSIGVNGNQLVEKNLSTNRYIVGAWYSAPSGLIIRSEYGHMRSSEASVKEDGMYILAGYQIDKFLPIVRWDSYRDRENKTSIANRDALLCGCTYAPIKALKFQLTYTHFIYTNAVKNADFRSANGNSIQAMAVAYF